MKREFNHRKKQADLLSVETERGLITQRTEVKHTELEVIHEVTESPEKGHLGMFVDDNEKGGELKTIKNLKSSKTTNKARTERKKENDDSFSSYNPEGMTGKVNPNMFEKEA